MGRSDARRFHDMGRRIERALATLRFLRGFGRAEANGDDLGTLLDPADSQISYRQRYPAGIARVPVLDLGHARSGQSARGIASVGRRRSRGHLNKLPVCPLRRRAGRAAAGTGARTGGDPGDRACDADRRCDARRPRDCALARLLRDRDRSALFLQGAEPLRAARAGPRLMLYRIRHVTRFDYAQPAAFARCNLRLKPILWSGQEVLRIMRPVGRARRRVFPGAGRGGARRMSCGWCSKRRRAR